MDDLLANINSHSTMIEDNINDSIQANESKILKINKNLASRASVPVKLEPINDTNEISNYSTSILKNNISFQNNSEKKKLRSRKKVTKPDKLMHITFRDKSMEEKPTSAKQSKINKCEKETEARKKFKNDKKVAKALGEMSKHFSKLHIGKIGERKYRFLNK
ncbi:PREDICTED: uncharacterized protein LOC105359516 [Ceratosolen solmsi marchali]|uniref:Uncharacterized protein LOC105359516 n=1 Tax=Ceratosolen solmsi marchali TaxID=326594 RepID=A0AAJ6VK06_9HYME|nr:PREDICTED: uncharacterized protein LOC105359516 [Ceratosolen solmsi marchali]